MTPIATVRRTALAAVLACAAGAPAAAASDADIDLYYKVYIGGFHVVDMKVDIGLAPQSYNIRTDLQTSGMIGRMFPWSMEAYSKGVLADGGVRPVSARQGNTWRGTERYIDLTFRNGVARVERIKPKADEDDRKEVPRKLRDGAVDLTSAVMAIITRVDGDGECRARVPVFDGRRRYDLVAEPDGTDRLHANGHSPFSGPTTKCLVWIDRKAGFRESGRDAWSDPGRRAQVWMGRAFGNAPPVPVRLTFDTSFGALIAHLNRATLVDGSRKQALNLPR